MLRSLKSVLDIMRADPAISSELPKARSLVTRALVWLFVGEMIAIARFAPQKFFIDELIGAQRLEVLGLIVLTVGVLHFTTTRLNRKIMTYQRYADYTMWSIWWSYGHRKELLLSSDWHTRHGTGEKESLVGKNISRFEQMVDTFVFDTIPSAIRILLTTIFLAFLYWPLAVLLLITAIVYVLVVVHTEKISRKPRTNQQREMKQLERQGTQLTQGWRSIKNLGLEDEFASRNHHELQKFLSRHKSRIMLYTSNWAMQLHVVDVAKLPMYAILVYAAVYGNASIGTVTLGLTWCNQALGYFGRLAAFQRTMNEGLEALRELLKVLQIKPTVQTPDSPLWPKNVEGAIKFQNVSFAYNGDNQHAVRNVNFDIQPHTTTAFIGHSGAGKSTLTSLLLREYDPSKGRILIDGIDLKQLDYERYRQNMVAIVPQAIQLFDTSIMENIRLSHLGASDEEVIEAAKAAHAHEFIMSIDKGYHAEIGEDGIRLSGGQRQRIAIAQALLRRPQILILDEATSALDAESQARVQKTLDELTAQRKMTIVIVAHRLSTIRGADQVIVMNDGRVAERGSHKELIARDGLYAKLRRKESA